MRVWSGIFNFFGIFMMFFMLMIFYKVDTMVERDFEEARLRHAVDYAVEAGFRTTLEVESIGIEYSDMETVTINPAESLKTFKALMCFSYDMSLSDENFAMLDKYIAGAVLAAEDGYYIATMEEIDTKDDGVDGQEYGLVWSLKKPYSYDFGDGRLYALRLPTSGESLLSPLVAVSKSTNTLVPASSITQKFDTSTVLTQVNNLITKDINYNINLRNKINQDLYEKYANNTSHTIDLSGWKNMFYLPSQLTATGVNAITRPTMLVLVQGVDFAGSQKLDTVSVGGVRTIRKIMVIGFSEDTDGDGDCTDYATGGAVKYYCYEGQLPKDPDRAYEINDFFNTVEDAAKMQYNPHYEYLGKPINRSKQL